MSKAGTDNFGVLINAIEGIDSSEHRLTALQAVRRSMARIGIDFPNTFSREKSREDRRKKFIQETTELKVKGRKKEKKKITLGLFNTYTGKSLQVAHIRAVARASPLCYAFNLNLCLFGFPIEDVLEIVSRVENETRVGESGMYIRRLFEEDSLFIKEVPDTHFIKDIGELVATTSRPDNKKRVGLENIKKESRPYCLLIGLGSQGLPKSILKTCKRHIEITGKDIPLETCTAMGVMAAKLGLIE
jgi:hypothetical protein